MVAQPYLLPLTEMVENYVHMSTDDDSYRKMAKGFLADLFEDIPPRHHAGRLTMPFQGMRPTASAWVVHPLTAEVMLMRHKRSGLLWPPGGEFKVRDGASAVACARRELVEETRLPAAISRRLTPWMSPLADIHAASSNIPEKPGTWLVFTIGFWYPADAPKPIDHRISWHKIPDLFSNEDASIQRLLLRTQKVMEGGFTGQPFPG